MRADNRMSEVGTRDGVVHLGYKFMGLRFSFLCIDTHVDLADKDLAVNLQSLETNLLTQVIRSA
jgi:hypothetical protein